jgi:hypothetical protein
MTAPIWRALPQEEQRLLVSPAWFVPYDDFRRRPYAAGLAVDLDRWDGAAWVPTGTRPTLTPGGVIAYPGLGRCREPWTAAPRLYRVRFAAPGYRVLYAEDADSFAADQVGREFLAHPYGDRHPPQVHAEAEVVRLLPATSFGYPPGTRVVGGLVRRAGSGAPIENALVRAVGKTTPEGVDWHEWTLSDATGAFRLSLRWAGVRTDGDPGERFVLRANERPGRTGEVTVRLPGDLRQTHVIEIS